LIVPSFIEDGYSESGYIAASEGVYDELHFEFRPMLSQQRLKLQEIGEKEPADKFDRTCAEAIASKDPSLAKLVSWSLKTPGGKDVPITADNILRMSPKLWSTMFNIIGGYRASDPLPTAAPGSPAPMAGIEQGEADAKN
jgi:hypothetical protein